MIGTRYGEEASGMATDELPIIVDQYAAGLTTGPPIDS